MSNSKLNDQVVDSVTAVDLLLAGMAPASAAGMLDAVSAESIGVAMHGAVSRQHQSHILSAASVTSACARMLQAFPPTFVVTPPAPEPVPPFQGTIESEIKEDEKQARDAVDRLEQQIAALEKNAKDARDRLAKLHESTDDPVSGGADSNDKENLPPKTTGSTSNPASPPHSEDNSAG